MSRLTASPWMWTRNEGAPSSLSSEQVVPLTSLPEGMVSAASNVDLDERGICIPRKGITAFSTAGTEPTTEIAYLFPYRNGATDELYAFTGTTMHRWNGSTWTSVTLKDTTGFTRDTMAAHYNGKVFLAYDSTVNRLHVYDGTSTRVVGIGLVAAATVANTGAGAYAATLRYYKIQMAVFVGSVLHASSELSASVSFTPSGAGTAARITKPTTIDGATHWQPWVSTDNVTYYQVFGWIVVGTTTYDDTVNPSAQTGNAVAPEAGLFVPPPSARFIVSDGTRLLMAGAHETSAGSGETTPSTKRVWYTRPLGATDEGDDEAITQTASSRYYIDIDDAGHTAISGLAAIGGIVYVFFDRSIWRLVPSGLDDSPYRSEQVSGTVGALSQQGICVGGTPDNTDDAIYFVSQTAGLHRISPSRGLEWLGRDVFPRTIPTTITDITLAFDAVGRDIWVFCKYGTEGFIISPRVINVQMLRLRGTEPHGGARIMGFGGVLPTNGTFFGSRMVFSGRDLQVGIIPPTAYPLVEYTGTTDLAAAAITASVSGPVMRQPLSMLGAEEPVVQTSGGSGTVTVGLTDRLQATTDARTVALAVPAAVYGYIARVGGLVLSDAVSIQPSVSVAGANTLIVESLTMPYTVKEAI